MRRVLLSAALVALAGEAFAQSMFRGDTAHTGAVAAIAPRQFHRLKWRFLTGGRVVSSPVFQDGVLYVAATTAASTCSTPRAAKGAGGTPRPAR